MEDNILECLSFKAMFSVAGIIWLIICLIPFGKGTAAGIVANCGWISLFVIIAIFTDFQKVYYDEDWNEWDDSIGAEYHYNNLERNAEANAYYYRLDDADHTHFIQDNAGWAINAKGHPSYICPAWVYNPAGLIWWSALFASPVILAGCFVSSKSNS